MWLFSSWRHVAGGASLSSLYGEKQSLYETAASAGANTIAGEETEEEREENAALCNQKWRIMARKVMTETSKAKMSTKACVTASLSERRKEKCFLWQKEPIWQRVSGAQRRQARNRRAGDSGGREEARRKMKGEEEKAVFSGGGGGSEWNNQAWRQRIRRRRYSAMAWRNVAPGVKGGIGESVARREKTSA